MKTKIIALLAVLSILSGISIQNAKAQVKFTSPFESQVTQPEQMAGSVEKSETKPETKPAQLNALSDPNNILGITSAENKINNCYDLIKQNKLQEARNIIEPSVEWLTNATEYHTNLYKALKDIDTAKAQAELERDLALKFALLRDQALYQLALLYIEEKKTQKAVEKLVNVVRSQPRTQLGFSAYQVLQEIGFTSKVQLPQANNGNSDKKNESKE
ncbi:MAG: hypothetical protein MZU95_04055 [Desulfomicrobium escambiense]|nr:hypothetical protein [Desulfomicrobium escambiense]